MEDGNALDMDIRRWAKPSCKYCHGSGKVKTADGDLIVCSCAKNRIINRRKPRPKENRQGAGPSENK